MSGIIMDYTLYNASYTKLSGTIRKMKIKVQETVNITSRHFCAFARFEVVIYKIICHEEIVQILWNAFFCICPYAQHIIVAATIMGSQPRFTKIWSNIGQEDIARLVCSYGSCGGYVQ